MTKAFLAERAFLLVGGPDAESFLQNLITTDLASLEPGEAAAGGLLTPQGKVLFHFLISREGDGFRLETDSASRDNLLKRLTMYRLRASVELVAMPESGVTICWDETGDGVLDRRFKKAGIDLRRVPGGSGDPGAEHPYTALRIEHGIAEAPLDFMPGEVFPHDILMDRDGGLHFRKGCYVGQEVVSRMQHRATARRRVVIVRGAGDLPANAAPLSVDGKPIGTLGSVSGPAGLAIVRIDKAGDAMARNVPVLADGLPVSLALPAWSGLDFPQDMAGDEP